MKTLSLFFLLLPCILFAQKKNDPAAFAKSITPADLQKHLYIVAGKEMEGRETATPGQKKAAAYIENYFTSIGLQPGNHGSYQMPYSVYRDEMTSSALEINGTSYAINEDFQLYSLSAGSISQYYSEVVFAGYGITDSLYDDYKGVNIAGKLVMVMDGAPSSYKPSGKGWPASAPNMKVANAQKKGAAALLIIGHNFPRKQAATTGNMYKSPYRPSQPLPAFVISEKTAAAITGSDWTTLEKQVTPKTYAANVQLEYAKKVTRLESSNVIGVLEGTDLKDEYVFLTAHYDHLGTRNDTTIFYGADDDGSGTVGVLELAEAFAKARAAGNGPRRSIVFMTVSGEEKGLWGSEYYAEHPIFPLDKTTVDLNIDMIGRVGEEYLKSKDSANYVYIIGDDKLSTDLAPITDLVNTKYVNLKLDRKYNDLNDRNRFYYRSDHYNFAEKGVPIIFYFNGVHADYHRATDTPDKINYNLLARRAQLVFYTAWEMANRDQMLKRDLKLELPKGF
ncbi:MAG: M28 family peptidase [Chitinophagaceae bacterium]